MNKKLYTILLGLGIFSSLYAGQLSMENKICSTEEGVKKFKIIKLNEFGLTLRNLTDKTETKFKNKIYHNATQAKFVHRDMLMGKEFSRTIVSIDSDGIMEHYIAIGSMSGTEIFVCK